MVVASLIERKRDGGALTAQEWAGLVEGYAAGRIPDYQMAALLMAVVWRGLAVEELVALTGAMLASGDRLDFGAWPTPRVDKHSTGGVGDKTSLILVPLVASCGVAVPMISGAGLAHTGGTVDKMESIPGFRTALTLREAEAQVRRIGAAMLRQTAEIAPADGKLYALRDVTATVESVPLIAASIMSKKLAEGIGGLVLDVKTGSGAFLPEVSHALELAGTMIALGEARGCRTVALLTAMDRPLGRACGNALEVEEALQALEGKGPDDLMTLTLALAIEMLLLAGVVKTAAEARAELDEAIDSGRALETFGRLVEAQGGDPKIVEDPSRLPQAGAVEVFTAPRAGVITRVEPRIVGRAIVSLGGGRTRLEDVIDPAVGFVISARPGDRVTSGEPIASVFARDDTAAAAGLEALGRAIVIEDEGVEVRQRPLISHRVTTEGVREIVTDSTQDSGLRT